jgi:phosphatidate cytidylyltransferase
VGFIFGFFASPLVIMLGCFFRPSLFPGGPAVAALLGVLLGLFTIVGDLFESGIKRSFGVKDSGTIILGRGGLLDSLDSLIFTAPLFYYGYALLNQFSVM